MLAGETIGLSATAISTFRYFAKTFAVASIFPKVSMRAGAGVDDPFGQIAAVAQEFRKCEAICKLGKSSSVLP